MDILLELKTARRNKGISQANLATRLDLPKLTITRLEKGIGSITTLMRVMDQLDFHIAGLAKGDTLAQQLGNRRRTIKLSVAELARRANVSRATVAQLETGQGSVSSMLSVMKVLQRFNMRVQKPQQIALHPGARNERDKRFTPQWSLDVLRQIWGEITLDPCGHEDSSVQAHRRITLASGGDGLTESWAGSKFVYVNPPFSSSLPWLKRCNGAYAAGESKVILALVPARTDLHYLHDHLAHTCNIALLRRRMQFNRTSENQDKATRAPFATMIIIWGASQDELAHFKQLCPSLWINGNDLPQSGGGGLPWQKPCIQNNHLLTR